MLSIEHWAVRTRSARKNGRQHNGSYGMHRTIAPGTTIPRCPISVMLRFWNCPFSDAGCISGRRRRRRCRCSRLVEWHVVKRNSFLLFRLMLVARTRERFDRYGPSRWRPICKNKAIITHTHRQPPLLVSQTSRSGPQWQMGRCDAPTMATMTLYGGWW